MKHHMKPVRIFLVLCSALMACNGENPIPMNSGDCRAVEPRLTGAAWKPYCPAPATRLECTEPIKSRAQAQELLTVAGGACLDRVVEVIGKRWQEDLAAAHLVRANRSRDRIDLLRALKTAKGFNRALALQKLGLRKDAVAEWNAVMLERSEWSEEAHTLRDVLTHDPIADWKQLQDAPERFARSYPFDSARKLLDAGLPDSAAARVVAKVTAENGDPYLRDVMEALDRPGNSTAMRAYREACASNTVRAYERAAALLERAGNPLHLYARHLAARIRFSSDEDVVPLLDTLIPVTDRRYRMLSSFMHTLRAGALEQRASYFQAHSEYDEALRLGEQSAMLQVAALSRRSLNYKTIGSVEKGFSEAIGVLHLLPRIADLNTHSTAYASAAEAATELAYPEIALLYRNVVIETAQKALLQTPQHERGRSSGAQHVLAVAFRARADTHATLQDITAAETDLQRARDLAEALDNPALRQHLKMRLLEVQGDTRKVPAEAVQAFRDAITQAEGQHSTYRADLHFRLAEARRRNGDPSADEDVDTAFAVLRAEANRLLAAAKRGEYEALWSLYFSRYQHMHRAAIQRSVEEGEIEEAFVRDEEVRAFEPLHLVLQSRSKPADFRPIITRNDLDHHLAEMPEDTAILQYLVLSDRTYVWVLTRGQQIEVFRLSATEKQINGWHQGVLEALRTGREDLFTNTMRAVHAGLFRTLMVSIRGKHLVIVPDGPMHGLPFAALEGPKDDFLLERVKSIATDGSTTRYLYARARDKQFKMDGQPSVLLAAATVFNRDSGLRPLKHAQPEVDELRRWYPQAEVLSGADATVERFLAGARDAAIVHFAGHAIPVPRRPWESQLFLASGELTAEDLMRKLSELERTRLVVLGACSTAGGQPVGPEGLAPLVRPLIAANVPAVVGTLWDVYDATAKQLLVSLHCHYRNGADVAEALRAAQLEMLRNKPAMMWAPYQVVGYAGSPYARGTTKEKTPHESVCAQHSLQRPDGLPPE
jgi:CHAT domain-containing protein